MVSSFQLPRVKVCGLTRKLDVDRALHGGAEALGFVLHPASPRAVQPFQVPQFTEDVPAAVPRVAVLVDNSPAEAAAFVSQGQFHWVQLCGSEQAQEWTDFPVPILRRIGVQDRALEEMETWAAIASGFVLDHPASPGGSGKPVQHPMARELCTRGPCLLAGGLHGGNVAAAIADVRPMGVDASSRIEQEPGIKDPQELQSFLTQALAAFNAQVK